MGLVFGEAAYSIYGQSPVRLEVSHRKDSFGAFTPLVFGDFAPSRANAHRAFRGLLNFNYFLHPSGAILSTLGRKNVEDLFHRTAYQHTTPECYRSHAY